MIRVDITEFRIKREPVTTGRIPTPTSAVMITETMIDGTIRMSNIGTMSLAGLPPTVTRLTSEELNRLRSLADDIATRIALHVNQSLNDSACTQVRVACHATKGLDDLIVQDGP